MNIHEQALDTSATATADGFSLPIRPVHRQVSLGLDNQRWRLRRHQSAQGRDGVLIDRFDRAVDAAHACVSWLVATAPKDYDDFYMRAVRAHRRHAHGAPGFRKGSPVALRDEQRCVDAMTRLACDYAAVVLAIGVFIPGEVPGLPGWLATMSSDLSGAGFSPALIIATDINALIQACPRRHD